MSDPPLAPTPATIEREPQPPYAFLAQYDTVEFQRVISNSPEALKALARKQAALRVKTACCPVTFTLKTAISVIMGLPCALLSIPCEPPDLCGDLLDGCLDGCFQGGFPCFAPLAIPMPTKKTLNDPTTDLDAASALVPGVQAPAMMDTKLNVLVTAMGEKGSAEFLLQNTGRAGTPISGYFGPPTLAMTSAVTGLVVADFSYKGAFCGDYDKWVLSAPNSNEQAFARVERATPCGFEICEMPSHRGLRYPYLPRDGMLDPGPVTDLLITGDTAPLNSAFDTSRKGKDDPERPSPLVTAYTSLKACESSVEIRTKALEEAKQAKESWPDSKPMVQQYQNAKMYLDSAKKSYDEAVKKYEEASAIDPRSKGLLTKEEDPKVEESDRPSHVQMTLSAIGVLHIQLPAEVEVKHLSKKERESGFIKPMIMDVEKPSFFQKLGFGEPLKMKFGDYEHLDEVAKIKAQGDKAKAQVDEVKVQVDDAKTIVSDLANLLKESSWVPDGRAKAKVVLTFEKGCTPAAKNMALLYAAEYYWEALTVPLIKKEKNVNY